MKVDFTRLYSNLLNNDDLIKGFRAKTAAEISAAKLAQIEKEEEMQNYLEEAGMTANGKHKEDKYEDRINSLFADFEKNLSKDFEKYGSLELDKSLKTVTDNIRGLADDMKKLSELAGGNPQLEQQAEKITANLLDRLRNDLELTAEERKKLEGQSIEQIRDYYAQTRGDKLDKFDETVNTYRQEVQQVIEQTEGKTTEEKTNVFQAKLDDIELKTHANLEPISFQGVKVQEVTLNDVKLQAMNSQTVSEQGLAEKQSKRLIQEIGI